jgi:hypothetical protein
MSSAKRWAKWVWILSLVFAGNSAAVADSTTTNFRIQGNAVSALFEAPDLGRWLRGDASVRCSIQAVEMLV